MRFWPRTIMVRTLAVLLLGFFVVAGIMASQMYVERQAMLTNIGGWHVVSRIAGLTKMINEQPAQKRTAILRTAQGPAFYVTVSDQSLVTTTDIDWKGRLVKEALQSQLGPIDTGFFRIGTALITPGPMAKMMSGRHGFEGGMSRRMMVVSLKLSDGSWLNFSTPPAPIEPLWRSKIFVLGGGLLLVVVLVCVWAVHRATQPLSLFAKAAERLGLDFKACPLDENGPLEVRQAAKAFNLMQHRLQTFIKDRTHMLAAISHDLRTPITRLKLRAEFVKDEEQRTKMLADLDEMESMISATLQFARDDAANEDTKNLDIAQLVREICDGLGITGHIPETLMFVGRPLGLKRMVGNLLGNAKRYGTHVEIDLTATNDKVFLIVKDDGPGIPEDMLDRVFDPFVRVEGSRSRNTGGTGLGLVAVKMVAQAHGGTVELINRQPCGLKARVTLPKS